MAGVALPTAPKRCGSALHEFDCLLPPSSVAVHCRDSAHYGCGRLLGRTPLPPSWWPHALREFRRRCGSALQEFHCPLTRGSEAVHCKITTL